jgi:hypothetical protein
MTAATLTTDTIGQVSVIICTTTDHTKTNTTEISLTETNITGTTIASAVT